jgi:hypothetical protein
MNVFAQAPEFDTIEGALGDKYNFKGGATIGDLFNSGIVNLIFFVAGAAFLLYLVAGGLGLMTSRGDPKAIEAGKARVINGLTGFIIIFTAYWIVQVVGYLLGLEGFGGVFGGAGGVVGGGS